MKLAYIRCPVCDGDHVSHRAEVSGFTLSGPVITDTRSECSYCTGGKAVQFVFPVPANFMGYAYNVMILYVDGKPVGIPEGTELSDSLRKYLDAYQDRLPRFHEVLTQRIEQCVDHAQGWIDMFEYDDSYTIQKAKAWQQIVGRLMKYDEGVSRVVLDFHTLVVEDHYDGYNSIERRRYPLFFFHDPAFLMDYLGVSKSFIGQVNPYTVPLPSPQPIKPISVDPNDDLPF